MTGLTGLCAAGAGSVVVITTTPATADTPFLVLLWGALALFLWSFFATTLLLMRFSLTQALWTAGTLALGVLGALLLFRSGRYDIRLLIGVTFVTLLISVAVWRLFRHEPS